MNKEHLITTLRELHEISGFRVSIHNTSFEEIAAYPEKNNTFCSCVQKNSTSECELCKKSNASAFEKALKTGESIIYKCRHNLIEAISPLYNFGILTGFLMIGQVRLDGESIAPMLKVMAGIEKNELKAREIVLDVPSVEENMIKAYVDVMTVCASYLTLSNSVSTKKASVGQLTMKFIRENFTDKITVKDICAAVGYSKSTVLSAFKREFSTTVNSYLNTLRLERAKKMLDNENMSINEIALCCGFSDQSYFSKVFSQVCGLTPTEYRRENK